MRKTTDPWRVIYLNGPGWRPPNLLSDNLSRVEELVGTSEIADLLGVSRQRVQQLASRPGFPEPVAVLSAGTIWRKADIERWIIETRAPRPGENGV